MVLLTSCSEKMKPNSIEIYLSETEKETQILKTKKRLCSMGIRKACCTIGESFTLYLTDLLAREPLPRIVGACEPPSLRNGALPHL